MLKVIGGLLAAAGMFVTAWLIFWGCWYLVGISIHGLSIWQHIVAIMVGWVGFWLVWEVFEWPTNVGRRR